MDRLYQRLLKQGKLRKQQSAFVQIEGLLREAIADLSEAKMIVGTAQRATYILAYMAMLKAGRALLLMQGYIPADGAQRQ